MQAGSKMAPLHSILLLVRGSALHNEIRSGIVVKPVCFNQDVKALVPNKSIFPKYLALYILGMKEELLKLVSSAGNSAGVLDTELVQKFRFLKPSYKEQTAIAHALSDVNLLLSELEKLIAKKQAIKTATMQQLLTGKTRLPQFAYVNLDESTEGELENKATHQTSSQTIDTTTCQGKKKGTKPSELGEIPEDWGVVEINEVISDLRGGAPFRPSDFVKSGVKVLPKGGVTWGGILKIKDKDQQFCNNAWAQKYFKNTVDKRYTIVVLRDLVPSGPSIGLMVKITSQQKYVLAQGVYGFLAQDSETAEFLIQYSNTIAYRKAANEIMVGSTQVHITNGAFKSLRVPFPPKKERAAIATILSDMDEEMQALIKRLTKTRQIKQCMMQELLTGKTRLPFDKVDKPNRKEREHG